MGDTDSSWVVWGVIILLICIVAVEWNIHDEFWRVYFFWSLGGQTARGKRPRPLSLWGHLSRLPLGGPEPLRGDLQSTPDNCRILIVVLWVIVALFIWDEAATIRKFFRCSCGNYQAYVHCTTSTFTYSLRTYTYYKRGVQGRSSNNIVIIFFGLHFVKLLYFCRSCQGTWAQASVWCCYHYLWSVSTSWQGIFELLLQSSWHAKDTRKEAGGSEEAAWSFPFFLAWSLPEVCSGQV
jgi:hypothetical protein